MRLFSFAFREKIDPFMEANKLLKEGQLTLFNF